MFTGQTSEFYLGYVEVSLFQQFSNDEDVGSGPISGDVILCRGYLCNERCCWVLNLLRKKQNNN